MLHAIIMNAPYVQNMVRRRHFSVNAVTEQENFCLVVISDQLVLLVTRGRHKPSNLVRKINYFTHGTFGYLIVVRESVK